MIQKQIGNWLIEYDYEKTKSIYQLLDKVKESCSCIFCENYGQAVKKFPHEVTEFFSKIGIDLSKPSEIYELQSENNIIEYGGWYHFVGNYLSGDDVWQPTGEKLAKQESDDMFCIVEGYNIGFTRSIDLVSKEFTGPVVQMEVHFKIPWVLDEILINK